MARHARVLTAPAHPWRRTARTAFAVITSFAVILPFAIDAADIDRTLPGVAGVLAVAAAITRVLALPQVEAFLRRFAPWLAAADVPAEHVVAAVNPQAAPGDVARGFHLVAGAAHPAATGTPVEIPLELHPDTHDYDGFRA